MTWQCWSMRRPAVGVDRSAGRDLQAGRRHQRLLLGAARLHVVTAHRHAERRGAPRRAAAWSSGPTAPSTVSARMPSGPNSSFSFCCWAATPDASPSTGGGGVGAGAVAGGGGTVGGTRGAPVTSSMALPGQTSSWAPASIALGFAKPFSSGDGVDGDGRVAEPRHDQVRASRRAPRRRCTPGSVGRRREPAARSWSSRRPSRAAPSTAARSSVVVVVVGGRRRRASVVAGAVVAGSVVAGSVVAGSVVAGSSSPARWWSARSSSGPADSDAAGRQDEQTGGRQLRPRRELSPARG